MKYRLKPVEPVEVEAISVKEVLRLVRHDWWALPAWFRSAYESGDFLIAWDRILYPRSDREAPVGWWVVLGPLGGVCPMSGEEFEARFEQVPA